MLGAQALRTKQRVEQKERERRQREKEQRREKQRESIQSTANEDQAAMLEFAAQQAAFNHHNGHHFHGKPHQRHSLHTTVINDIVPLSAREGSQLEIQTHRLPPRSPSTDYTKDSEGSSAGNRLLRFLGLSSNNHKKNQAKRRMSTY